MVTPWPLTFDISTVAVSTALPGFAWAILFVLAWRHPRFARSVGLGPKAFWLLLPGALLASFALIPVAPVSNDILAVDFAGALFPLGIATVALGRVAPPFRNLGSRLFLPLFAETAAMLGVVILAGRGSGSATLRTFRLGVWGGELCVIALIASIATALVVALSARRPEAGPRIVAAVFGLTTTAEVLTFAGSRAIPGVGIAESFPYFLLPPIAVGALAVLLAGQVSPANEGIAFPVAFFAAGWGVTLGADVLWQPPLYGTGPAGLYAIGGAGVLDLVYLSGFLALLGAWGAHRLLGRALVPVGEPPPLSVPSPSQKLRQAYVLALDGAARSSVGASAAAANSSAVQAHRLLGRPILNPSRPWDGLGVPGWVVSDHANLASLDRSGTAEPREAWRAYVTARALVGLGETIGSRRFASIGQRMAAYAIDAGLVGVVAAAVFAWIVRVTPGGLDAVLSSTLFNAAVYGFVGFALLYFAVTEAWSGATLGKAVLGIEVKDRALGRADGLACLLRNAPLLPAMTLYSLGLALSIALAMHGLPSNQTVAGVPLPGGMLEVVGLGLLVLAGFGVAGAIGVAAIAVTSERQRVGDVWAATWVVRRLSEPTAPPSAAAPAARSA